MIKKRKLWKAFAGTLAAMVSFVAVAQPISYLPNLENALVAEAYDVGYYVTNRSTGARVYAEPNGSVRGAAQMYECFYVEEVNGNWGRTNSIYALKNDSVVCVSGWVNLDLAQMTSVDSGLGIPVVRRLQKIHRLRTIMVMLHGYRRL